MGIGFDSPPHDESKFQYRSVIGKLNYLAQCTRPDIVYAVHQCARFSSNTSKEHTDAVEYIARYLKGTSDLGLSFKPDIYKSFEFFADADYCGNWSRSFADDRAMYSAIVVDVATWVCNLDAQMMGQPAYA